MKNLLPIAALVGVVYVLARMSKAPGGTIKSPLDLITSKFSGSGQALEDATSADPFTDPTEPAGDAERTNIAQEAMSVDTVAFVQPSAGSIHSLNTLTTSYRFTS